MPLDLDPNDDFRTVVDGIETVTFYRRGSQTGSAGTTIAAALRRAVTTRAASTRNRFNTWKDVPSQGRYAASDVVWHLPVEQLAETPLLGDLIIDADSRRWTVLEVQSVTLDTRWACLARDLVIAHGLDDTITILQATHSKGTGGAAQTTWQTWRTGIRARIQPAAADSGVEHRAYQTEARFQIFLEEDLPLDHAHRIRASDGSLYRINGTNNAQRIGELQTINTTRIDQTP